MLPIENAMADPSRVSAVIFISMGVYCLVMLLVAIIPVVTFSEITQGSLTAELGHRFREPDDRPWVAAMNLLVTIAVILTYPVQFYPCIEVIEARCGVGAGLGAASRRRDEERQRALGGAAEGITDGLLVGLLKSVPDAGTRAASDGSARDRQLQAAALPSHRAVLCKRVAIRCACVAATMAVAAAVPNLGKPNALSPAAEGRLKAVTSQAPAGLQA